MLNEKMKSDQSGAASDPQLVERRRKNWEWLQANLDALQAKGEYAEKWLVIDAEQVVFHDVDEDVAWNWLLERELNGQAILWHNGETFYVGGGFR